MKTSQSPVWLVLCFQRLGLELHWRAGADPTCAQAVFDPKNKRQSLVEINEAAAESGIASGQTQVQAAAVLPELRLLPLNPQTLATGLAQLATWAYRYSGQIRLEPPRTIALELAGSLKLFGGRAGLLASLRDDLRQMGFSAAAGLGRSLAAARLRSNLAGVGLVKCAFESAEQCQTLPSIAKAPVSMLPLADSTRSVLQGSGIETLGALLKIPPSALRRRFGKGTEEYLQRLQNQRPEPGDCYQPPRRYRAEIELPAPTELGEALWFPIRRLITDLCISLRSLDLSVDSLSLEFELEYGDDGRDHRVSLRRQGEATLATPSGKPKNQQILCQLVESSRDPHHLFELCKQRLERVQLGGKVLAMTLLVDQLPAPSVVQTDLLNNAALQRADWPKLMERLGARLGAGSLLRPQALFDHRPECASRPAQWVPEKSPDTELSSTETLTADLATQPLWLLTEPEPIAAMDIRIVGLAERIEGGWWDSHDVRRDYYRALHVNGGQCWVYRELRTPSAWYLHGWFG